MQLPTATKWLVMAGVAVATLVPGMPAVAESSYSFQPMPLWLAMLYLVSTVFVAVVLCIRLLRSVGAKSSAWRHIASFIVVLAAPALTLLLALLPFALLIGANALLGPAPWLSQWVLFNKYVGHFAVEAARSHVWLMVPAVILGAWLYAVAHSSERRVAENAL